MHVNVKWITTMPQFPKFNVEISTAEGKEPFITINGCRIATGKNGEFVAMPSTKNEKTGKYWNHAYPSPEFSKYVLEIAQKTRPVEKAQESKPAATGGFADMEDNIPF